MSDNDYKKRFRINVITSLFLQIITAIVGMILPRMIIVKYGSETNGIIMSITQLLAYISLLEAGVGGVIRASLYKPLAEENSIEISSVVNASRVFFGKIAKIFLIYLIIVALLYPLWLNQSTYSSEYISLLVIILGAETLIQYFFGISYQMLLSAGQQIYFINLLQTGALIGNAIMTFFMIRLNMPIHIVKAVSMLIFVMRPVAINIYARRQYKIDKDVAFDKQTLANRWDGLGQHIAYFVHNNTDMVVLSLFSGLKEVSVYHVYSAVIAAVKKVVSLFNGSVSAVCGTLYASGKKKDLQHFFFQYESFIFVFSTWIFSITAIMILPFITVYTYGITDAIYIRPIFGVIIVFAEYMYIVRAPYSSVTLSAGFYGETRNGGFVEAGLNIFLSLMLVGKYGVAGVAVGTLVAMSVRTFEFALFANKKVLECNCRNFFKKLIISMCTIVLNFFVCKRLVLVHFVFKNYIDWIYCSTIISIITLMFVVIINFVLDRKGLCAAIRMMSKK